MTDKNQDLRTRIAAALLGDHCVQAMTGPCEDCRAHALRQADAVIRELRLKPVEGTVSQFEGRTYRRYITDWLADA